MSARTHMVSLPLDLTWVLRQARISADVADHGYSLHCTLAQLFGDLAPRPFFPDHVQGRWVHLLGYTSADRAALKEHADAFCEPGAHSACDWERFSSKAMPARLPSQRELDFEVRVCPVVRLHAALHDDGERAHRRSQARTYAKGSEIDIVQARRLAGDEETPRDMLYTQWLRERLERAGAELLRAEVARFRLARLWRRTQGEKRKGRRLVRPDVVMRGALRVVDPTRFTEALRRGVGRHAAFGFGMLRLRAPSRHATR